MNKLFLLFIVGVFFGCINKKNNIEIEKSVFSKEELKILEPHFEIDTTATKIKAIKIQTH
tara:strand:- start:238 stop:417 length:180 start_codon:yes stop_codon:yes gene_type:complete